MFCVVMLKGCQQATLCRGLNTSLIHPLLCLEFVVALRAFEYAVFFLVVLNDHVRV